MRRSAHVFKSVEVAGGSGRRAWREPRPWRGCVCSEISPHPVLQLWRCNTENIQRSFARYSRCVLGEVLPVTCAHIGVQRVRVQQWKTDMNYCILVLMTVMDVLLPIASR
jgi:hypothetical protein